MLFRSRSGIAFRYETWEALAKHLHPGAFGMAFASARGWHRLAVAIEDSGMQIHPSIFGYSYGSGFPKASRIDSQCQKRRGVVKCQNGKCISNDAMVNLPYAERWYWYGHEKATEGHRYGLQALKPALEPIIVFQKPYEGKPVECITETGAGALWGDGGRVGTGDNLGGGTFGGIFGNGQPAAKEGHPSGR